MKNKCYDQAKVHHINCSFVAIQAWMPLPQPAAEESTIKKHRSGKKKPKEDPPGPLDVVLMRMQGMIDVQVRAHDPLITIPFETSMVRFSNKHLRIFYMLFCRILFIPPSNPSYWRRRRPGSRLA